LAEAAQEHFLTLPIGGDELAVAVDATLKANNRSDGFVKVVVTRGAGPLTLDPRKCVPVTIILAEEAAPFPRDLYDCGLDVITVPPLRPALVKAMALRAGCLEALTRRPPGDWVTSGCETALGWVIGGQVRLAPAFSVTHDAVGELARVPAGPGTGVIYADLLAADEVFLTSAAAEVIAVRSIDGRPVGSGGEGPVVKRLRQEFAAMVRRECAVS
jgi:branched-chain amino acid aminotransferase